MNTDILTSLQWPSDFDFRKDETCQNIFKPFIEQEMQLLKEFDEKRPQGVEYVFHQHATRVANDVRGTCRHMGFGESLAENMYWATLVHDIGKRLLPVEIWDLEGKPSDAMRERRRSHTILGEDMVRSKFSTIAHPFKRLMSDIILNHHEKMDGSGYRGLKGNELSYPVRLVAIIEAFDGWQIWRPHYGDRDISTPGVLKRMRDEKGAEFFDMDVFEIFAEYKIKRYKETA